MIHDTIAGKIPMHIKIKNKLKKILTVWECSLDDRVYALHMPGPKFKYQQYRQINAIIITIITMIHLRGWRDISTVKNTSYSSTHTVAHNHLQLQFQGIQLCLYASVVPRYT